MLKAAIVSLMAIGNIFLVRFKAPHTRAHSTGTGNLAKNTCLGPHSTRAKHATIICLFVLQNEHSIKLPSKFVSPYL